MFKGLSPALERTILGYFSDRFGIKQNAFGNFAFYMRSKNVYLGPKTTIDSPVPFSIGIFLAAVKKSTMPSHSAVQLFGKYATKNIIELDQEAMMRFIRGDEIKINSAKSNASLVSDGHVIVRYLDFFIAAGILKKGVLKLAAPFGMAERIRYF